MHNKIRPTSEIDTDLFTTVANTAGGIDNEYNLAMDLFGFGSHELSAGFRTGQTGYVPRGPPQM